MVDIATSGHPLVRKLSGFRGNVEVSVEEFNLALREVMRNPARPDVRRLSHAGELQR
jgi:hypothetical protein